MTTFPVILDAFPLFGRPFRVVLRWNSQETPTALGSPPPAQGVERPEFDNFPVFFTVGREHAL
jgi:hypothetical protein